MWKIKKTSEPVQPVETILTSELQEVEVDNLEDEREEILMKLDELKKKEEIREKQKQRIQERPIQQSKVQESKIEYSKSEVDDMINGTLFRLSQLWELRRRMG